MKGFLTELLGSNDVDLLSGGDRESPERLEATLGFRTPSANRGDMEEGEEHSRQRAALQRGVGLFVRPS